MKRINRLVNPVNIIAMFAVLSEASATTILPYLDEESRQVYIWFLIAFPSALVVFFFLTLNFNSKVLYTPTDMNILHHADEKTSESAAADNSVSKEAMALNLSFRRKTTIVGKLMKSSSER